MRHFIGIKLSNKKLKIIFAHERKQTVFYHYSKHTKQTHSKRD